jgi:hypothetical protein
MNRLSSVFFKGGAAHGLLLLSVLCAQTLAAEEVKLSLKKWKNAITKQDPELVELFATQTKSEYFAIYRKQPNVIAICHHEKDWKSPNFLRLGVSASRTNPRNDLNFAKDEAKFPILVVRIVNGGSVTQFPDGRFYEIERPSVPIKFVVTADRTEGEECRLDVYLDAERISVKQISKASISGS